MTDKERAIALRKKGKTYSEIIKIIGKNIPKGTLSSWLCGVALSPVQKKHIEQLREKNLNYARSKAVVVNKKNRERFIKRLVDKNVYLVREFKKTDTLKLLLAMLYLGEGAKWKTHRGLQLGSSDPHIIKVYLSLLERCYNVDRKILKVSIFYRADQKLDDLISFWSNITRIPINNFYRSKPDLRTVGKPTRVGYYGVCAICGPGTEIQLELHEIAQLFSKI